ncbi:hypothetical protein EZS27_016260 [termite gut metagenome]|uniref:DUF5119 domain-containing protein n=1 Tax=termite gut metagenome TaxID=433724 RepID=A0A5J4RR77_9ZZZZ
MRRNYMSINKRLFLLIYLIAICASCTKEDVTRRAEGDITIKPLWKEYIVGKAFPPEIEYYLYNLDNISISPIIISDPKGEGFTKRLPVGTYRLIGYNKADASKNITFKDSKPSTVVAKISQDDFIPLNLYIVSCDNILIKDNSTITKEIVPIEVKAKTLSLNFSYRDELNPLSLKGKIEGISTSINLLNGEAFEDENFISFETKGNNLINLRTSGLLYTSSLSADSRNYELIPPVLSLTFEDGSYTGDVSLENIIKELDSSPQKPNDITLDVIVKKYTPQYEKYKNRILIETYLNKDK